MSEKISLDSSAFDFKVHLHNFSKQFIYINSL